MSEYNIQMNKYNALNAEYDQLYPQPMKHASTHASGGTDPITPGNIGAYSKNETDTLLANKADASSVYTKEESISAATRTALGLATNATPDAAFAKIAQQLSESGNVKMGVAWENASPSSSFAAQTVSIPTGYDMVAIYTPFTGQLYWFEKGVDGPMLYSYLNEGDSTPMMITRNAKFVDGSVTFSDAKRNVGGSVTTGNTFMIPTKIYGIKL